jgi:hypothetical protein
MIERLIRFERSRGNKSINEYLETIAEEEIQRHI